MPWIQPMPLKQKLKQMSQYFPPGMKVIYPYDTTPFTKVAIEEVVKTLIRGGSCWSLSLCISFMGTFRATLIPTIAVPVVLLGTFGVLGLFGFSINMLTMFAMVLAIGLLVDDAIVVVENVERIMAEEGLSPREATAKSMDEITSALIGIGLVSVGGFRSHGFFPWFHRRHLPTVFRDCHFVHASFRGRCPGSDPGAVRYFFKTRFTQGHEPADGAILVLAPLLSAGLTVLFFPRPGVSMS